MAPPEKKQHQLISYLLELSSQEDRASLAALRSALRPGRELDALRFVVPFLQDTDRSGVALSAARRRKDEEDAVLLAALFALHPEPGALSLASALSRIFHETQSESIEGRFRALLSADRTDLATHLRHAVSLCASKGIPLDWNDLYSALRFWDHEDDRARRAWARDFWASNGAPEAPDAAPPSTTNPST